MSQWGVLPAQYGDRYVDQEGSFSLSLPDTEQISIHQYLSQDWAVMADIFHAWWGMFAKLNIEFSGDLPANVIPENGKMCGATVWEPAAS